MFNGCLLSLTMRVQKAAKLLSNSNAIATLGMHCLFLQLTHGRIAALSGSNILTSKAITPDVGGWALISTRVFRCELSHRHATK
ncbi:hypothetical protein AcV5_008524 [Taiwanofungus camphoratus]|nr:hypothetical protein AcV5_008524 [Antrodia cinnamomea]